MSLLAFFAVLSAIGSIAGFVLGVWPLAAGAKVATTALIIVYAWRRGDGDLYSRAVLVGLLASLAGDAFLLAPVSGFLPGLVSFLVAHLVYLYAFSGGLKRGFKLRAVLAYAALVTPALALLWPNIPGDLRLPAAVYAAALAAMAAMAASMAMRAKSGAPAYLAYARAAAIGAGLFVISDATLAIDKFAGPVPLATVWVLTTYWFAQWLIASSVGPAAR